MNFKVVFKVNQKVVFEWPVIVSGKGDIEEGVKQGFHQFRKEFPDVSLLNDAVQIGFDTI